MGEFEFIQRFCTSLGAHDDSVVVGVGDDAAIVDVPANQNLLVSTDTMNVGQHFYADANPADLAHKLIHTNVSDIAAMGGQAKWATVALSLSKMNPAWLEQFSTGLNQCATDIGLAIIGGDTTKGPLSMSLTIMGTVAKGQGVLRSGAQPNDLICVTGVLGGAAAGLNIVQSKRTDLNNAVEETKETPRFDQFLIDQFDQSSINQLVSCLNRPEAQHQVGRSLAGYANSCIDLSDGLAGDLHHILRASRVNASLDWAAIPCHPILSFLAKSKPEQLQQLILYGGEDYQLAFTISENQFDQWRRDHSSLIKHVSQIGRVGTLLSEEQTKDDVKLVLVNGDSNVELKPYAFQHF